MPVTLKSYRKEYQINAKPGYLRFAAGVVEATMRADKFAFAALENCAAVYTILPVMELLMPLRLCFLRRLFRRSLVFFHDIKVMN